MTPEQLISNLTSAGPQDLCVVLQYLADWIYEARIGDRRISDSIDCKIWLEELAKVAQVKMLARMPVRAEQARWGSGER